MVLWRSEVVMSSVLEESGDNNSFSLYFKQRTMKSRTQIMAWRVKEGGYTRKVGPRNWLDIAWEGPRGVKVDQA